MFALPAAQFILAGKARRPAGAQSIDLASRKPGDLGKLVDGDEPRQGQERGSPFVHFRRRTKSRSLSRNAASIAGTSSVTGSGVP